MYYSPDTTPRLIIDESPEKEISPPKALPKDVSTLVEHHRQKLQELNINPAPLQVNPVHITELNPTSEAMDVQASNAVTTTSAPIPVISSTAQSSVPSTQPTDIITPSSVVPISSIPSYAQPAQFSQPYRAPFQPSFAVNPFTISAPPAFSSSIEPQSSFFPPSFTDHQFDPEGEDYYNEPAE